MNSIITNITEIFNTENIVKLSITIALFLIFLIFHKQLAKVVLNLISTVFFKNKEKYKKPLINSLTKPLSFLFIILGFLILSNIGLFSAGILKMFKILIILVACWAITSYLSHNLFLFLHFSDNENDTMNTTAVKFLSNILKIIIIAFAVVMVISELGYNINGLITGIGVGGLAISLAAQEAVSNMISGFIIIFEKPFIVGDLILSSDLKGYVVEVKMRSTTIKTLEDSLVTIPNSTLTKNPIINLSKTEKWLISTNIGLEYSTSNELLEQCRKDIENYLIECNDICAEPIRVNFSKFEDSSLNINITCYANTHDYDEYLKIDNNTNFKIKQIIENNKASFAFPSTSVYIEK